MSTTQLHAKVIEYLRSAGFRPTGGGIHFSRSLTGNLFQFISPKAAPGDHAELQSEIFLEEPEMAEPQAALVTGSFRADTAESLVKYLRESRSLDQQAVAGFDAYSDYLGKKQKEFAAKAGVPAGRQERLVELCSRILESGVSVHTELCAVNDHVPMIVYEGQMGSEAAEEVEKARKAAHDILELFDVDSRAHVLYSPSKNSVLLDVDTDGSGHWMEVPDVLDQLREPTVKFAFSAEGRSIPSGSPADARLLPVFEFGELLGEADRRSRAADRQR